MLVRTGMTGESSNVSESQSNGGPVERRRSPGSGHVSVRVCAQKNTTRSSEGPARPCSLTLPVFRRTRLAQEEGMPTVGQRRLMQKRVSAQRIWSRRQSTAFSEDDVQSRPFPPRSLFRTS